VLGLREEIRGGPLRRSRPVAYHDDLRRSGDHVDADDAEDLALRLRDISVSRADDLVDAGDGARTVGERGHRLRAADGENPVYARDGGRREHEVAEHAARRRHDHHDLPHAGHLRG